MIAETVSLRSRYCKDNDIRLQLFQSPYFEERLELMGRLADYKDFIRFVSESFGDEEEYFIYGNMLKSRVIDYIKGTDTYKGICSFNTDILNSYDLPSQQNVYTENNIGMQMLSIDMTKANFSAFVTYAKTFGTEFADSYDYGKFLESFTPYGYFAKSKNLRQVIFGNCNPKKTVQFEKFLMANLANQLIQTNTIKKEDILSFCSDELVLKGNIDRAVDYLSHFPTKFPLNIKQFTLGRIAETEAFIRLMKDGSRELKCVNAYDAPFIYRFLRGEKPQEHDRYFVFEGKLAKLIDIPDGISIVVNHPWL